MQNSKLIRHLRAFNKTEMKQLEKFIASPFFVSQKSRQNILPFFLYLKKYHPHFEGIALQKEKIIRRLFPKQKLVTGRVEKMMSTLLRYIRQFITHQVAGLKNDAYFTNLQLSKFYEERQMDDLFQLSVKRLEGHFSNSKPQDKDYYRNRLLLDQVLLEYESTRNDRKGDLNLPAIMESLDHYYLSTKLQYACMLLSQHNYQKPLNVNDSLNLLYHLLPLLEQGYFQESPIIQVYYRTYLFLQHPDEENYYHQFQQTLQTHQANLPSEQLKSLLTLSRIYCIRQANKGQQHFLQKAYKLYKDHLENGLMQYDGKLLLSSLRNIVTLGLKLKKYDWVRTIIEVYRDKIADSRSPEQGYNFNMAHYYFATQSYNKALDCLAFNYEDVYYKLAARRLELKIYYEQDSLMLESKIEAFKVYLHRNSKASFPELQRKGNINFINMLIQIIHPKTLTNKERVNKLLIKVHQSEGIAEKEWLIEKLQSFSY